MDEKEKNKAVNTIADDAWISFEKTLDDIFDRYRNNNEFLDDLEQIGAMNILSLSFESAIHYTREYCNSIKDNEEKKTALEATIQLYGNIRDNIKTYEENTISVNELLVNENNSRQKLKEIMVNIVSSTINDILPIEKKIKEPTEIIKTGNLTNVILPLDKVNDTLWKGNFDPGERYPLKAERDKDTAKGITANIWVSIDFEELEGVKITRTLDYYDKNVFTSLANLKKNGYDIVTASQVYTAMAYEGKAGKTDREKILKSIEFMSMARVYIDNREEVKIYNKYDEINASFPLISTEIIKRIVNGTIVNDAIRIIEVPRLFDFAEKRKHITTVPIEVLRMPISKTNKNLMLRDYLFKRIAKMKNNENISRNILFATIYENCEINDKSTKSRLPNIIESILKHFEKTDWIKKYTITPKDIKITL